MADNVAPPVRFLETVYRSRRGDYLGLKAEIPPPPGSTGTRRLVFLKTTDPETDHGRSASLAHEIHVHRALTGAPGVVPFLGTLTLGDQPARPCAHQL